MKIAMIGHKCIPSRDGGVEVVVEELAARLASWGHDVHCYNRVASGDGDTARSTRLYRGIWVHASPLTEARGIGVLIHSAGASLKAISQSSDVIHLHAEGPASMALLTHLANVPTVVTIHGLDWQRIKWGRIASGVLHMGERIAVAYADELIVLTQSAQQYFDRIYGRAAHRLPNGVSAQPRRKPEEIARRWALQTDGYALCLTRIVPEKGLHDLIAAFRGVPTAKRLIIAGRIDPTDPYTARILSMAGTDRRIVLTNIVCGSTLAELLCNCCLYVLPSYVEGMSMSLLEALSAGARCLVSGIAENRETAGRCAWYFPPGDVIALRAQLCALLDAPDTAADRMARIRHVREHHNWNDIAHATLRIYEKAIGRSHRYA